MSLILGIDPGSRKTGYGLIEYSGKKLTFIECGFINAGNGLLSERLDKIFIGIEQLIATYKPDEAAIEQVFLHKNAKSALVLGHARGVAMVAATHQGLPIAEYAAREIKQAVVGNGGAKKEQVQLMIRYILSLSTLPQSDAADALAVAVCHAHTNESKISLAKALNKEGLT